MKRFLDFRLKEQKLEKSPSCSFDGIVSGSKGYLRARFSFSKEWSGCACVAVFRKLLDEENVVLHNGECEIPPSILDYDKFYVRIVGRNSSGAQLTTNEVEVTQIRGGGV